MKTPAEATEEATIEVAEAYAAANGYPPRSGARLLIAGMAIMACCDEETRRLMLEGYFAVFPEAKSLMLRWAERIENAR